MAGIKPEFEALLALMDAERSLVYKAVRERWEYFNVTGMMERKFSRESLLIWFDDDDFQTQYQAARRCYPHDAPMVERLDVLHVWRDEMFDRAIDYFDGICHAEAVEEAMDEFARRTREVRHRAADLFESETDKNPAPQVETVTLSSPPIPNGLVEFNGFCWDGTIFTDSEMTMRQWKFLKTLFDSSQGWVVFDDFAKPIWGSELEVAQCTADAFGSYRRYWNNFFLTNCIALHVTVAEVPDHLVKLLPGSPPTPKHSNRKTSKTPAKRPARPRHARRV